MSTLANVFAAMPLASGLFLDARFTAPWCISAQVGPEDCGQLLPVPDGIIAFHYVYRGSMTLVVETEPAVALAAGEVVILPRNPPHLLGSDCNLEPMVADALLQPGMDGDLSTIRYGESEDGDRMICGFLGCDRPYLPLLELLPAVIKLTLPDAVSSHWFESSFRLAARERVFHRESASLTLARLIELLFLEALQQFMRSQPDDSFAWFGGASDSRIMRALVLIGQRPNHRWSTEELAKAVGMSRSAFATRFTELVGLPPMRYLTRQRLQLACRRLQGTREPLIKIALEIGYESEAAFNRAFKREYGLPPATWRGSSAATT